MRLSCASILAVALTGCSSFETRNCNGVDVLVLRDMNEVYPTYAQEMKFELDLAVDTKAEIGKIAAKGKYEDKVIKLYQDLDQINYTVRTVLATSYSGFVSSLCSAKTAEERRQATDDWNQRVAGATKMAVELRKLNAQVPEVKRSSVSTEFDALIGYGNNVAEAAKQAGFMP